MPHIDEDIEQRQNDGRRTEIHPEELEKINFRVLSTSEKMVLKTFIIQPETSLELIFFRVIFTRLRKQYHAAELNKNAPEEEIELDAIETVPFEAYQRAFERLFFLLNDDRVFRAQDYDENGDGTVSWGEFFHVYKREEGIVIKLSLCERIYFTFDNPDSSYLAQIISVLVLLTIILSSCCFIISTVDECQAPSDDGSRPKPLAVFHKIELGCLLIFVLEYLARITTCWNVRSYILDQAKLLDKILGYEPISLPSPVAKLATFFFAPSNIIDLLAILPGVISLLMGEEGGGGLVVLRLVRLTRIFRAFKNPAMNEPVIVIGQTLQESTKALYVLCFQLLLLIVISGSLMWLAEQGQWNGTTRRYDRKVSQAWNNETRSWDDIVEESPFQSIPHAFWWAIVTATTVGYGDQNNYPVTAGGYIVAVLTMSVSLVITALPVGVIGGTFSQVWASVIDNRKREKAERRSEMEQITKAIQTLDPTRMSKLLFIQVWNSPAEQRGASAKGDSGKRSAAHFMGEALLDMPLENEPLIRQETLRLMDNNDIVKRSVRGRITVRYEWTPSSQADERRALMRAKTTPATELEPSRSDSQEEGQLVRFQSQKPYRLHGELMVTVVSAEGLVNLDGCKRHGISSPYCTVYVYPKAPGEGEPAWPDVWRYPTAAENLSPRWGAQHSFCYRWDLSRSGPRKYSQPSGALSQQMSGTSGAPGEDPPAKTVVGKPASPDDPLAMSTATIPAPVDELAMDTLLEQLVTFRHGIREMKEELQSLEFHVDRLSSSDTAQPASPPGAPAPPAIPDERVPVQHASPPVGPPPKAPAPPAPVMEVETPEPTLASAAKDGEGPPLPGVPQEAVEADEELEEV